MDYKLYAFADEASKMMDLQIAAMKRNGLQAAIPARSRPGPWAAGYLPSGNSHLKSKKKTAWKQAVFCAVNSYLSISLPLGEGGPKGRMRDKLYPISQTFSFL